MLIQYRSLLSFLSFTLQTRPNVSNVALHVHTAKREESIIAGLRKVLAGFAGFAVAQSGRNHHIVSHGPATSTYSPAHE